MENPRIILKKAIGLNGKPCEDQIAIFSGDRYQYPMGLTHVDAFWMGRDGSNKIYNALLAGDEVMVELVVAEGE